MTVVKEGDVFNTRDLRRRAYAGYFRSRDARPLDGSSRSEEVRIENRVYVVIAVGSEIIVIFRVDSFDGHLRRLRRYPPGLVARYNK